MGGWPSPKGFVSDDENTIFRRSYVVGGRSRLRLDRRASAHVPTQPESILALAQKDASVLGEWLNDSEEGSPPGDQEFPDENASNSWEYCRSSGDSECAVFPLKSHVVQSEHLVPEKPTSGQQHNLKIRKNGLSIVIPNSQTEGEAYNETHLRVSLESRIPSSTIKSPQYSPTKLSPTYPESTVKTAPHSVLDVQMEDPFGDDTQDSFMQLSDEGDLRSLVRTVSFTTSTDDGTTNASPLCGRTLFYFTADNSLRIALFKIFSLKHTSLISFLLTVLEMVFLTIETSPDVFKLGYDLPPVHLHWYDWAQFVLFVFFTLGVIFQLIAFGGLTDKVVTWPDIIDKMLEKFDDCMVYFNLRQRSWIPQDPWNIEEKHPQRCFFRKSWNRVEALSVACFWVWFLKTATSTQRHSLMCILSGLAHLRILKLLDEIVYTRVVLQALKSALPLLINVFLFIGFFCLLYTITGQQSFPASLKKSCVWKDPLGLEPDYHTGQICGSYLDPKNLTKLPYLNRDGTPGKQVKGFTCPVNSVCQNDQNPHDNTVSFDNFFNSLEMVFIIMSQNTYSDIMYDVIDGEYMVSSLFFMTGVAVLSWWLLSLLVAVMASSFGIVRKSFDDAQIFDSSESTNTTWLYTRSKLGKMYLYAYPIFIVFILLDLIFQAAFNPHGIQGFHTFLYTWQCVTTTLLLVEIIIRFCVFFPYWRMFFQSMGNCTDLTLALITLATLPLFHVSATVYAWLSFFQLVRVYRFVALFPFVRRLWRQLLGNYRTIVYLMAFFLASTYLCSLIASKMLRGQVPYNDEHGVAPVSFYSLGNSLIGMYQIASTENWTEVLFHAVEGQGSLVSRICVGIFLCTWLAFANFVIMNMFVAVMTDNLSLSIKGKRQRQVRAFLRKYLDRSNPMSPSDMSIAFAAIHKSAKTIIGSLGAISAERSKNKFEEALERDIILDFLKLEDVAEKETFEDPRYLIVEYFVGNPVVRGIRGIWSAILGALDRYPSSKLTLDEGASCATPWESYVSDVLESRHRKERFMDVERQNRAWFDRPLFIFGVDNKIRHFCQRIFPSSHGKRASGISPSRYVWYIVSILMILITGVMVVSTCVNTPLYHLEEAKKLGHDLNQWMWLNYMDTVFTAIFTLEFMIKIIADGFHYTPNAYTHNPWNRIDFVVLLFMWMTLINDLVNGPVSRYSRGLMALRALRLITINPQSDKVFRAVFFSGFKNILIGVFITLATIIPYSIWGVNLFKGNLDFCNDDSVGALEECVNEYLDATGNWAIWAPRAVKKPYFDFDSFGRALLIQFGVLSLEGWTDVLNAVTSSTGDGMNPKPFATMINGIYPILYNFLGTVLLQTMIIAILVQNYAESRGTAYLTAEQLSWQDLKQTLAMVEPEIRPPNYGQNTAKAVLYKGMLPGNWFSTLENWLLAIITITLMCTRYPQPRGELDAQYMILIICSLFSFAGMVLRLIVLRPRVFILSGWNILGMIFSLFLTVFSLILLSNLKPHPVLADLQRAAVIAMLLLWIPKINRIRQLFRIATRNFMEIATLIQTWFILFLTYAIAFNQSFGLTRIGPSGSWTQNFRTVPKALVLLFRMSTGEGWNMIMEDFTVKSPHCLSSSVFLDSDCGTSWLSYLLFITWNIISMYCFANLFISLIYDTFWHVFRKTNSLIKNEDVQNFRGTWCQFDPDGSGYMQVQKLHRFLRSNSGYFTLGIYSQDPDFNVNTVLERSRARLSTVNPYIVDYEAINEYLKNLPSNHFRKQRELFEIFNEQVILRAGPRGIKISQLLQLFPIYRDINPSKSFELEEFVQLKIELRRVRVKLAVNFVIRRWRFRQDVVAGIIKLHGTSGIQVESKNRVPEICISQPGVYCYD